VRLLLWAWRPGNIQLYSPECTLAENININNNEQNKDRNILINVDRLLHGRRSAAAAAAPQHGAQQQMRAVPRRQLT